MTALPFNGRSLRNVLIFAHECAPYHRPESTIGAQRPWQFAKWLPQFGYRAIVLCCDQARRGAATASDRQLIQAETKAALAAADDGSPIILPLPSLAHDGWIDRRWRALQSGGQAAGLRQWIRQPLTVAKFFTGDYSQAWQPCARWAAEEISRTLKIDFCVGEHSPDAGIFLARWFARTYGTCWAGDFRDPLTRMLPRWVRPAYRAIVRRWLASAAFCVQVTPAWAEEHERHYRRPTWNIPNGWDSSEWPIAPRAQATPELTIIYAGSFRPTQRMDLFCEGMARLKQQFPALGQTLRFIYRGVNLPAMQQLQARYSLQNEVDAAGQEPRDTILARMQQADGLLLLSLKTEDEHSRRGLYPGKVFEYFAARRPILNVVGDNGLLDELITRSKTGVTLTSAQQVSDCLKQMVDHKQAALQPAYTPDDDFMARFTRRNETAIFARLMDDALSGDTQALEMPARHDHPQLMETARNTLLPGQEQTESSIGFQQVQALGAGR